MTELNNISNNKGNEKKKGNMLKFVFTIVSVFFQTGLTFYLLSKSAISEKFYYLIVTIGAIYFISFVLLILFHIQDRKLGSSSGAKIYKKCLKVTKYVFKILMLGISVVSLISATKVNFASLFYSILLLAFNIYLIAFDVFVWSVTDTIKRKQQRILAEKQKREQEE